MFSKPLLLFALLAFFVHRTAKLELKGKNLFAAALFFSLAGDIALLSARPPFFLVGMGLFFAAHVCYIGFQRKHFPDRKNLILSAALLSLVLIGMVWMNLWVDLPKDLLPYVNIYGVVLGINFVISSWTASELQGSARWIIVGFGLFIASDLLLVYAKFNDPQQIYQIVVMLTYGLAQYSITAGVLTSEKVKAIEY